MRNIIGADRHVDFHSRRHVLPEHLKYLARRLGANGWLAHDLDNHILAVHGFAGMLVRHQDLVVDASILRHHESNTAFFKEPTDRLLGTVFQHLDNHTFTTTAIIHAIYPGSYPVAVKHLPHLARRQEQIRATVIGNQKPEAIPVPDNLARDQICLFQRQECIPAIADQLSVAAHGNQTTAQGLDAFLRLLPQLLAQCLVSSRRTPLFQVIENKFPTLDGIVVFLGLAVGVRVPSFFFLETIRILAILAAMMAAIFIVGSV